MISVENLSVRFGGTTLFDSVTLMINDKERAGLVGRNGAGKTTLLKIIAGFQEPSGGQVIRSGDQTVGYLPQQMIHRDGKTVYEETLLAFDDIINAEKDIVRINDQLAVRTDYDSPSYLRLIDKLDHLNDSLQMLGGNSIQADIEKTLIGLGFNADDLNRPVSELSGGWRMRIELARLLLKKPDFLLLDEPTNHLDIHAIEWLESFLTDYPGGIIMISHDRVFLDNITSRTIELRTGKAFDFRVPYSQYVELKEERMIQQMAAFQNQKKMIRDNEKFIQRFRYKATKAVQVQSRIKMLNKVQRIEVEEEDAGYLNIKFPPAPRSGTIVVEAENLSKSFGTHDVLDNINIIIERGEKVAFVGRNGEGKTTLSRIITGELDYKGKLKTGHNVSIGYFAQNQDELLDDNLTPLETIDAVAVGDVRKKIRDILGAFLFGGDDAEKKIKVLSGGERSRLSLAKLLLQHNNLLVLDEPTNHLDMRSKDILKNALLHYNGTLIVVSHDREFLDGLVDKIYEFRNHKVKQHIGGIFEFLEKRKLNNLREIERKARAGQPDENTIVPESTNKHNYNRRKEHEKKVRRVKNELERIETDITGMEKRIGELENLLANPENIRDHDLFSEYGSLKASHDTLLTRWEKLHTQLEELINFI